MPFSFLGVWNPRNEKTDMTRRNYDLKNHPQLSEAVEFATLRPNRRISEAWASGAKNTAAPAVGTPWTTAGMAAVAASIVTDTGALATQEDASAVSGQYSTYKMGAANGDSGGWVTGATAADPNGMAVTRRQWNPTARFVWLGSASVAAIRLWIGLWSGAPNAVDTLAGLSAAAFGYDTTADATVFWRCKSGDAIAQQSTTTTVAVTVGRIYKGEIRINDAAASVEFWLADCGPSTAAQLNTPLELVATHTTRVPVAATPLFMGGTVTALGAAIKRLTMGRMALVHDSPM